MEQAEAGQLAASAARQEARAQEYAQRSEQLAASMVVEQGVGLRDALIGRGPYRTRQEFLSQVSAEMDRADAWEAAAERAAYQRWQAQHNADVSAPTSELEFESARQKAWAEEMAPRIEARRQKKKDEARLLRIARRHAQWDRGLR